MSSQHWDKNSGVQREQKKTYSWDWEPVRPTLTPGTVLTGQTGPVPLVDLDNWPGAASPVPFHFCSAVLAEAWQSPAGPQGLVRSHLALHKGGSEAWATGRTRPHS